MRRKKAPVRENDTNKKIRNSDKKTGMKDLSAADTWGKFG